MMAKSIKTRHFLNKILAADYTLPDFLSDEAKDMMDKICDTDPDKRITIDRTSQHPWYQINKPEPLSFYVCPPAVQEKVSDKIMKGSK